MGGFYASNLLVPLFALLVVSPSLAVNPDHLDIRLNKSLFESSPKKVSYGTIIHIDGLKDWKDSNVVDLAFAAHARFSEKFKTDTDEDNAGRIQGLNFKKDQPGVTTTIVVDNTAYIATSLRGRGSSYIYDVPKGFNDNMAGIKIKDSMPFDNAVIDGLRRCQAQAVTTDRAHKNMANCGEYMAALAFCIDTDRRDLENARMVTINTVKETDTASGKITLVDKIIPPCDKVIKEGVDPVLEQWGCRTFAAETKIKVLDEQHGREAVDISEEIIRQGTRPQISYP